jgi:hypothetical protein
MNYGYSQQVGGGFGRYGMSQPYQAPSMPSPQGPSGLQRYAQGLDKQYGQIQFLKEQGFSDDEIQKKFGLNPNIEQGIIGQYGGLMNQRDSMKGQLQQDIIGGIESGAKYLGKAL